jgi:hypothetical protein
MIGPKFVLPSTGEVAYLEATCSRMMMRTLGWSVTLALLLFFVVFGCGGRAAERSGVSSGGTNGDSSAAGGGSTDAAGAPEAGSDAADAAADTNGSTDAIGAPEAGSDAADAAADSSGSTDAASAPEAGSDAADAAAACLAAGGQCLPCLDPGGTACLVRCDGTIGFQDCGGRATCCLAVCDPNAPVIRASSFDQTCAVDTDCVAINEGSTCNACNFVCPTAAISVDALPQYSSATANLVPASYLLCPSSCPAGRTCCRGGMCHLDSPLSHDPACPYPGQQPVDSGEDSGDAGPE